MFFKISFIKEIVLPDKMSFISVSLNLSVSVKVMPAFSKVLEVPRSERSEGGGPMGSRKQLLKERHRASSKRMIIVFS